MMWGSPDHLNWLWTLIPAAWIIYALLKRRERLIRTLVDAKIMDVMVPLRRRKRTATRAILWLGAITSCLIALARPQWGFHWDEVTRKGLDVMVVLDTSKSMLAEDIKPNRLQQAKWGIGDLVSRLHGDRVGLIAFAGSSFLQCPLTSDYAAFMLTLDDVYVGIIPRGGTSLSSALTTAVASFEEGTQADKTILLITDGEDHEGDTEGLVEELRSRHIRLYCAGIGTLEGDLIPARDEQGRGGFMKDRDGHVIKTALKESTLERLAVGSGGMYVRSTAGNVGLDQIYERGIAGLKRAQLDSQMVKRYEDRFLWFLALAMGLLAVEACLSETYRKQEISA